MKDSITRQIAVRYLWTKRREAFITFITVIAVLGVALGVAVLNITMSIMSGFEFSLREKVVGSSHVLVQNVRGTFGEWLVTSEDLQGLDGVKSVSAFTQNQGLLTVGGASRGVLLKGLLEGTSSYDEILSYVEQSVSESPFRPVEVRTKALDGSDDTITLPPIILGRALARKLRVQVGAPISVLSPDMTSTPFGLSPKMRRFVVSGIYHSGLSGYEEALAYTSIAAAQSFFELGDTISGFDISLLNPDHSKDAVPLIFDILNDGVRGGFIVTDWTEQNRNLWEAIKLEKKVYFIVLLLLIVLASFTIVSSLVMIVMEKRRDIAILKTLGAEKRTIARIFHMSGAVVGIIGTVLGLLIGLIGSIALREYGFPLPQGIFPEDEVPVRLDYLNFLLSGICAFVICLLSTVYPARRASSLDPAEVLRYE